MERGDPRALWEGTQTGAGTVESGTETPQKTTNGMAFPPSTPTSGNTSEGPGNTSFKEHMDPYVHGSVIYDRRDLEAAYVPASRQVDEK